MGEVPVIVDSVSPEVYNEEFGRCSDLVVADPLIVFNFSVPMLLALLLIVRLEPMCWDVSDDPAAGLAPL